MPVSFPRFPIRPGLLGADDVRFLKSDRAI